MTMIAENTGTFVSEYEKLAITAPEWVGKRRAAGMAQFRSDGFPHNKQEAWRNTNISFIARTHFAPAPEVSADAARELFEKYSFGRQETNAELVFVNGHYAPELSQVVLPAPSETGRRVVVKPLSEAFDTDGELVRKHLGKYARIEANPFVALNQGFMQEGAFVHVSRGSHGQKPIHLLFLTLPGATAQAAYPRNLVVVDEGAEAQFVETYAGGDEGVYFTNAVTEIVLGEGALIDHNKLQQEGAQAQHIATMTVHVEANANFISHSTSMGSKLTRNDLNCYMMGERAEVTLNGLVLIGGEQHVDNHTLLHHGRPNCPSHELYKHVLDGHATGVFKGQIFVDQAAQKTDSKQTSKTLLLSDTARMDMQPALEIYADDVKCTHGSTIGPVDENAVFYLQSRGVSQAQARHLMTYAFAADITRRIRVQPVRARIEDYMAALHGLPQDLRITEEADHTVPLM